MPDLQVSATRQSHVVWEIDSARSFGEVSTRHWLWGRRAGALDVVAGRVATNNVEWLTLNLTMRSTARDGASVNVGFVAALFSRVDYGKLIVSGELRVDEVVSEAELRLHDLGTSAAGRTPARRTATIAGRLLGPAGSSRIWRRISGRHPTIFAHTEWVTRTDLLPLAG